MVEIALSQGGVYLAHLNPAKADEVGKTRPVVILTSQFLLQHHLPIVFICPLSSQSYPEFESLHIELPPRDSLKVTSFALTEHCRAISTKRILQPRLAQLSSHEIKMINSCLNIMISIDSDVY